MRTTRAESNNIGPYLNEEAARKLIYLAISNAVPAWRRTRTWTTALSRSRSTSASVYPSEPPSQKLGRPPVAVPELEELVIAALASPL